MPSETQSKMFHLPERLSSSAAGPRRPRTYLKRAALFGAGLVLLWIAIQLTPTAAESSEPDVYSDGAGTIAASSSQTPKSSMPGLFAPGNLVAILLLAGGVGFAVYLRRRSNTGHGAAPISTLGEVAVGQNQSLRLVECGDEILLLGITSGQINLIRSYRPERFQDFLEARPIPAADSDEADKSPRRGHFSDVLRQYAGRYADVKQNGAAW